MRCWLGSMLPEDGVTLGAFRAGRHTCLPLRGSCLLDAVPVDLGTGFAQLRPLEAGISGPITGLR